VKDLRLLLEQSARREEKLAGMVQAVIDERFFRPVVTSDRADKQILSPAIDPEMSDVTVFDSDADAELVAAQVDRGKALETQFHALFQEQFGEVPPSERHQEEFHEM